MTTPIKIGRVNPKDSGLKFARTMKAKKPTVKRGKPEAEIQGRVEAYCDSLGLPWFHIPAALLQAGFAHGKPVNYAIINAAQDVRGFPDLTIFDPSRGRYLSIELKTKVGRATHRQRDWLRDLNGHLCRGFEEAKDVIDGWLNG